MKRFIFFLSTVVIVISCNNNNTKSESKGSDSTKIDYPYTLKEPYQNWQAGDQKNAVIVMKMLKAWETKNLTECASYFADSVDMSLDSFHQVMPHDSLMGLLKSSWDNYSSITVKMEDWEPVISSDKKTEWVTLWYNEKWVDTNGKTDSLAVINDAKMVNGKIAIFDEKIRHYPPAKK